MRGRPHLVGFLWRWHRRIGLLAGLLLLMLAATGIVLNHTGGLALDQRYIHWQWLLRAYGDTSAELPAFELGGRWLYRSASGHLFFDTGEVASCRGELVGAARSGRIVYAACSEELLLLDEGGNLIEAVGAGLGMPVPLLAFGLIDQQPVVQTAGNWWLANLDEMDFSSRAPGGSHILQMAPGRLPAEILSALPGQGEWLSWERLLLDLHSGRLFGRAGVWLVDLAGVALWVLALSGVVTWWLHRHRQAARGERGTSQDGSGR